jgi:hypothetical protein
MELSYHKQIIYIKLGIFWLRQYVLTKIFLENKTL